MARDPLPLFVPQDNFGLEIQFTHTEDVEDYDIYCVESNNITYVDFYPTETRTIQKYIDTIIEKFQPLSENLNTICIQHSPSEKCNYEHRTVTTNRSSYQLQFQYTQLLSEDQVTTVAKALGKALEKEFGQNPIESPSDTLQRVGGRINPKEEEQYSFSGSVSTTSPGKYYDDDNHLLTKLAENNKNSDSVVAPLHFTTDMIEIPNSETLLSTYLLQNVECPPRLRTYNPQTHLRELNLTSHKELFVTYNHTLPYPLVNNSTRGTTNIQSIIHKVLQYQT